MITILLPPTADVNNSKNNVPPINSIELLDLTLFSSSVPPAFVIKCARNKSFECVRFDINIERRRNYLQEFFDSVPSLQKVTWNHCCDRNMYLIGYPLHPTIRTKEIVKVVKLGRIQ